MFDLILRNGIIYIGDGSESFIADVAIRDGKIAAIGKGIDDNEAKIINVTGKVVSPGFIDAHSHSELTLLADPDGKSKISQGVTSEVVGNCGLTAFPVATEFRRKSLGFIDVPGLEWKWHDTESYLQYIKNNPSNINTAPQIGHGSIRAAIIGYDNRKASAKELRAMQDMLAQAFDLGFIGLSTGLGYAPDFYGDTDELVALAEVVEKYNTIFTFHPRGERETYFTALNEIVEVAHRTGAHCEISHLKCGHPSTRGQMPRVLSIVEESFARGDRIGFDHYPYIAGNSYLGLVFPPWVHADGMEGLIGLLANKEQRKLIKKQIMEGYDKWVSFIGHDNGSSVYISNVPEKLSYLIGKSLPEVASILNVDVPEACCLLVEMAKGKVEILMFQQLEDELQLAMQNKHGVFCSDGFAMDKGELIKKGTPHPRSFGTFTRILGHYVRDEKVLTMADAIHRMTGQTALRFNLSGRGFIKEGYYADITVFDPDKIIDTATYENPFNYSEGVEMVFVNGVLTYDKGIFLPARAGKILLR